MAAPAVIAKAAAPAVRRKSGFDIITGRRTIILAALMLPVTVVGATLTSVMAQIDTADDSTAPPVGAGTGDWVSPMTNYVVTTEWWGYYGHTGIDLAGPQDTPIYAAASGTVKATHYAGDNSYGWHILIEHADGVSTLYAHLSRQASLPVGQQVHVGQHIGFVGNTGNSTGPHLHFETRMNGVPQDPRPFMASHGISL